MTLTVGEPDLIEPNSYQNIALILENVGIQAGVEKYGNGKRKWLFLENGGRYFSTNAETNYECI